MSNKPYAVTIQSDQPLYTEAEAINMVVDKLLAHDDIQVTILAWENNYNPTKDEVIKLLEAKDG